MNPDPNKQFDLEIMFTTYKLAWSPIFSFLQPDWIHISNGKIQSAHKLESHNLVEQASSKFNIFVSINLHTKPIIPFNYPINKISLYQFAESQDTICHFSKVNSICNLFILLLAHCKTQQSSHLLRLIFHTQITFRQNQLTHTFNSITMNFVQSFRSPSVHLIFLSLNQIQFMKI